MISIVLAALAAAGLTGSESPTECRLAAPVAPEFYVIELVSTRRIPGSGAATGTVDVTFAPSPFGVSLTENGDYLRDLEINVSNLRAPDQGSFVVWVTTPQLDRIEWVGVLGDGTLQGQVRWNKFLVVVSLEQDDASTVETILIRVGMVCEIEVMVAPGPARLRVRDSAR